MVQKSAIEMYPNSCGSRSTDETNNSSDNILCILATDHLVCVEQRHDASLNKSLFERQSGKTTQRLASTVRWQPATNDTIDIHLRASDEVIHAWRWPTLQLVPLLL